MVAKKSKYYKTKNLKKTRLRQFETKTI